MGKVIDLTGQVFGRLTVVRQDGRQYGQVAWLCECSCGNQKTVIGYSLRRGATNSCGCLQAEIRIATKTTHGLSKSPEYNVWGNIKKRCLDPNCPAYFRYGGAGIGVHEEWVNSFEAFYAHIGPMPQDGNEYSCDRIDNNKGYYPGNVRWATWEQQARNKSLQKNNHSGVTGVYYRESKDGNSWVAIWNGLDKRQHSKCFGTIKHGYDGAFRLACDYRAKMLEELNKQGAGYTASHGL